MLRYDLALVHLNTLAAPVVHQIVLVRSDENTFNMRYVLVQFKRLADGLLRCCNAYIKSFLNDAHKMDLWLSKSAG